MQAGEQHTMTIHDVGLGGVGVGRVDGMAVFVPFVAMDEEVEVEITRVSKRFAHARLLQVRTPSDDRIEAPCPHYGVCGGCDYQHLSYAAELRLKHKQLLDTYRRIGRFEDPPVAEVIPSPNEYGYRNKITLHGPGRAGYHAAGSHDVVPIEKCLLASDAVNGLIPGMPELGERERNRVCRATTEGKTWCSTSTDKRVVLEETIRGIIFRYGPESFFQVNVPMLEVIAEHLDGILGETPCRTLIDAYGGVGVFSVLLARRAGRCIGIEFDRQASHAAAANAAQARIANCEFYAGQVESVLPEVLKEVEKDGLCILLDPPRSGCSDRVLKAILSATPERILYIACDPATQARDLRRLADGGYRIKSLTPFDLFPRTGHVEVVAHLVRGGKKSSE